MESYKLVSYWFGKVQLCNKFLDTSHQKVPPGQICPSGWSKWPNSIGPLGDQILGIIKGKSKAVNRQRETRREGKKEKFGSVYPAPEFDAPGPFR